MCDTFLQNYANIINNHADNSSDLIPSIILFTGKDCTGTFYTNSSNANTYESNPYNQGDTVTSLPNIKSFFIPFNFKSVKFSSGTLTKSIVGPFLSSDTDTLNWGDSSESLSKVSPTSMTMDSITDWNEELRYMCMGNTEYISIYSLNRFRPHTSRCDEFMENTFCKNTNLGLDECSCFRELPEIIERSSKAGVSLPVNCFGEDCVTKNSYKTLNMIQTPCNLTICTQTINQSNGSIVNVDNKVFCAGKFFNNVGTADNPVAATPTTTVQTVDKSSKNEFPFYIWIILGVSAILFVVLVYLLFAPSIKFKKKSLFKGKSGTKL